MSERRLSWKDAVGWAVLLSLAAILFEGALARLFNRWWTDPTYSHGLLVPAISLFFLYDRRESFK
jgi:hypothetical protein